MPNTQPPSHHSTPSTPVPNATKPERGKALLTPNSSNCQKRGDHCAKRSQECCREQENHSQKVCNATPMLLSTSRTSLDAAKSYSIPRNLAAKHQSYSLSPERASMPPKATRYHPRELFWHNYAPQIKQMPLSYLKGISEVRSGIEPL